METNGKNLNKLIKIRFGVDVKYFPAPIQLALIQTSLA